MSLENPNALIDHLDRNFAGAPEPTSPEAAAQIQRSIAENEDTAREWHYLQLAVNAVQDAGLREQVAKVRTQWEEESSAHEQPVAETQSTGVIAEAQPSGVVRNLYRNAMRVAACALLIAGGACIFKYVRLSSSSLYSAYYSSYDLNTSRGSAATGAVEQAYVEKNWPEVLSRFAGEKIRSNKTEFLAGMADMELKKFDDAIAHFEQVIASNSTSHNDYFEDEAEYYLAISWLAKNKVNEAMPILEKIKADKGHLYHDKVEKMSFTDLRLVQYKENK